MKYPLRHIAKREAPLCDSCLKVVATFELSTNPMIQESEVRYMCGSCLRGWARMLEAVIGLFGEEGDSL